MAKINPGEQPVLLQGVKDPVADSDAATKAYVDANGGGGGTDNITASEGLSRVVNDIQIDDAGVVLAKMASGSVGTGQLVDDAVTNAKIASGAIANAQIAANAVTESKLNATNTPTSGQVLSSNADDPENFTWVDQSGGGTDNITASEGLSRVVNDIQLDDEGVTTAKLDDLAVTADKIADGVINYQKLDSTNTPTAGQVLSAASTPSGFTWVNNASSGSEIVTPDQVRASGNYNDVSTWSNNNSVGNGQYRPLTPNTGFDFRLDINKNDSEGTVVLDATSVAIIVGSPVRITNGSNVGYYYFFENSDDTNSYIFDINFLTGTNVIADDLISSITIASSDQVLLANADEPGFIPPLSGVSTEYLDGSGAFSTPAGALTAGTSIDITNDVISATLADGDNPGTIPALPTELGSSVFTENLKSDGAFHDDGSQYNLADASVARAPNGGTGNQYVAHTAGDGIEFTLDSGTDHLMTSVADDGITTDKILDSAVTNAKLASIDLDFLSDVDTTTTTPLDDDVLTWNQSNTEWTPARPLVADIREGGHIDITKDAFNHYTLKFNETYDLWEKNDWVQINTGTPTLADSQILWDTTTNTLTVPSVNGRTLESILLSARTGMAIQIRREQTNIDPSGFSSGFFQILSIDATLTPDQVILSLLPDETDIFTEMAGATFTYELTVLQFVSGGTLNNLTLGGLSDTDFSTAPVSGQVLGFNSNNVWVPQDAAAADISGNVIGDLMNVSATAATDGQVLSWDNTNSLWTPVTDPSGVESLDDLSDVTIANIADDQILRYNTATSAFENVDLPAAEDVTAGFGIGITANEIDWTATPNEVRSSGNYSALSTWTQNSTLGDGQFDYGTSVDTFDHQLSINKSDSSSTVVLDAVSVAVVVSSPIRISSASGLGYYQFIENSETLTTYVFDVRYITGDNILLNEPAGLIINLASSTESLQANTTQPGFVSELSGDSSEYFNGTGAYTQPTIDALGDVGNVAPSANQVLTYDGNIWNAADAQGSQLDYNNASYGNISDSAISFTYTTETSPVNEGEVSIAAATSPTTGYSLTFRKADVATTFLPSLHLFQIGFGSPVSFATYAVSTVSINDGVDPELVVINTIDIPLDGDDILATLPADDTALSISVSSNEFVNPELGDLLDVDFSTAPTDGQVLAYELSTDTWKPADDGGGSNPDLGDLGDVNTNGVADGFVIRYDGDNSNYRAHSIDDTNRLYGGVDIDMPSDFVIPDGSGTSAVAIGDGAAATTTYSVSIGQDSTASGTFSTAVGRDTVASSSNAVALGSEADAGAVSAVAIGDSSDAAGTSNVAIGNVANSSGVSSTAVGHSASATGGQGVAIGVGADATFLGIAAGAFSDAGVGAVSLGANSNATSTNSIALGRSANATAESATAIGEASAASHQNSTAIGEAATTEQVSEIRLGSENAKVTVDINIAGTEGLDNELASVKYVKDAVSDSSRIVSDNINGIQYAVRNSQPTPWGDYDIDPYLSDGVTRQIATSVQFYDYSNENTNTFFAGSLQRVSTTVDQDGGSDLSDGTIPSYFSEQTDVQTDNNIGAVGGEDSTCLGWKYIGYHDAKVWMNTPVELNTQLRWVNHDPDNASVSVPQVGMRFEWVRIKPQSFGGSIIYDISDSDYATALNATTNQYYTHGTTIAPGDTQAHDLDFTLPTHTIAGATTISDDDVIAFRYVIFFHGNEFASDPANNTGVSLDVYIENLSSFDPMFGIEHVTASDELVIESTGDLRYTDNVSGNDLLLIDNVDGVPEIPATTLALVAGDNITITGKTIAAADSQTLTAGDGISIASDAIAIDFRTETNNPLEVSGTGDAAGLSLNIDEDGPLQKTTNGLDVILEALGGLGVGSLSSGIQIQRQANSGIGINADGVTIDLGTGSGLQLGSSGLSIELDGSTGLNIGADGLSFLTSAGGGLTLNTLPAGIAIQLPTNSGLQTTATGLSLDASLDDLNNVSAASPTDGQVIQYNSTSEEWENADPSGGGNTLTFTAPLVDTSDTISLSRGDGLVLDTNDPVGLAVGGGNGITVSATGVAVNAGTGLIADATSLRLNAGIDALTDVNIKDTLADGQILEYDSDTSMWVNTTISGGGNFTAGTGLSFNTDSTVLNTDGNMIEYSAIGVTTGDAMPTVADGTTREVAIGADTSVGGVEPTAIGFEATATGDSSTAIGTGSSSAGDSSTAIGGSSSSSALSSVAIGGSSSATGASSLAVGTLSNASALFSIALGYTSTSSAFNTLAVGNGASATATDATALGHDATASSIKTVAIGPDADATLGLATAVGSGAQANGASTVSLGDTATSSDTAAIAIGADSAASDAGAIALGHDSTSSAVSSIAIGNAAQSTGVNSIGIGDSADGGGVRSIAIGNEATTGDDATDTIVIGTSAGATGTNCIAIGNDPSTAGNTLGIAIGERARVGATRGIAIGSSSDPTSETATFVNASGTGAIAIGRATRATGQTSLAIGDGAFASNIDTIAIGEGARSAFANSFAIGNQATTTVDNSTVLGSGSAHRVFAGNREIFTSAAVSAGATDITCTTNNEFFVNSFNPSGSSNESLKYVEQNNMASGTFDFSLSTTATSRYSESDRWSLNSTSPAMLAAFGFDAGSSATALGTFIISGTAYNSAAIGDVWIHPNSSSTTVILSFRVRSAIGTPPTHSSVVSCQFTLPKF